MILVVTIPFCASVSSSLNQNTSSSPSRRNTVRVSGQSRCVNILELRGEERASPLQAAQRLALCSSEIWSLATVNVSSLTTAPRSAISPDRLAFPEPTALCLTFASAPPFHQKVNPFAGSHGTPAGALPLRSASLSVSTFPVRFSLSSWRPSATWGSLPVRPSEEPDRCESAQ